MNAQLVLDARLRPLPGLELKCLEWVADLIDVHQIFQKLLILPVEGVHHKELPVSPFEHDVEKFSAHWVIAGPTIVFNALKPSQDLVLDGFCIVILEMGKEECEGVSVMVKERSPLEEIRIEVDAFLKKFSSPSDVFLAEKEDWGDGVRT